MNQKVRIYIGIGVLVALVLLVVGVEALRRGTGAPSAAGAEATLAPGSVPVYWNGRLAAGFSPQELERLNKVSFVEPVEGKTQEGWLLRDVLRLYLQPAQLQANPRVVVSSSSRQKSVQLTWAEIEPLENYVMFDLAGRGTLKLASKLEKLDTREEWIQDVDKIEVSQP